MFFIDPFSILLLVLFCLLLVKVTRGSNQNVHPNFPPGPKPLPIIGNMHILDLKRPYRTFLEVWHIGKAIENNNNFVFFDFGLL